MKKGRDVKIKVSVVVSVYNMEAFIGQCMDSIIGQTLRDIEIICVNDGSTDTSEEILKKYEKTDHRIIVLSQNNKGAAAARNLGIEHARGEYIAVFDSDDFYDPSALEKAYVAATENDADIVVFRSDFYNHAGKKYEPNNWSIMTDKIPDNPFSADTLPDRIFNIGAGWASDKLFRKELLDENKIRFQEIRTTNDMFFVYYAYSKAQRIYVLDEVLGHVRINAHKSLSVTREESWDNVFFALKKLKDSLIKDSVYEKHRQSFVNWALNLILWHINTLDREHSYMLREQCRDRFFTELDIAGNAAEYFYDPDEYNRMEDIMDGDVKVSVIIPVYNAEKYIRQCLDTVISQTLKDIEIICVDDGSTDETPWILSEYAEKDHRISIISKEHSNAGDARNEGLRVAKGRYLSFLDADDFFEPGLLEKLYYRSVEEDSDICMCRSDQFDHNKGEYRETPWTLRDWEMPEHRPFSAEDAKEKIFNMSGCTAWDKLFSHRFIKEKEIYFQSNSTGNDMFFTFSAMVLAERISTVDEVLIHQRTGHPKKMAEDIEYCSSCFFNALFALKEKLIEKDIYKAFKKSFINWALDFSLFNLHIYKGLFHDLIYQKLRLDHFDALDITTLPEEDFYNRDQYLEMLDIIKDRPKKTRKKISDPKLSVLIPIYNVSRYLRLCLDSAIYQTLYEIEIICVNDGSTDNCLDIIREYAQKDKRIVVIDGPNGGYGKAMNKGLAKARGKYLGIIEPDDFVDVNMFKDLYDIAEEHQLDFVKSDFYRFKHDTNGQLVLNYNKVAAIDENYNRIFKPADNNNWVNYIMNTWCAVYRRDFITANNILHNETPGASYQDNGFSLKTHIMAERVMYIDKPYYLNRRDNPNSSILNKEKVHATDTEYKLIKEDLSERGIFERFSDEFYCRKAIACLATTDRIGQSVKKDYIKSFSKDIRDEILSGLLKQDMFSDKNWLRLQKIAADPEGYYYKEIHNKCKVSVILAIYNQQRYIRPCLDSILNQSLKNIEVICVNDGSTDKTREILEEYKDADDRVIVIDQENKGAGAARNEGLKAASGEYLSFLDSDDFFDKELFAKTVNRADKTKADICIFKTWLYDNLTGEKKKCLFRTKSEFTPKKNVFNRDDVRGNIFLWVNGTASDKLMRRSFVESNGLQFQEQRTTNDAYFAYAAIFKASAITVLDEHLYYERRNNPASLSNTRHLSWMCYYHALLKHKENLVSMGLFDKYERDFVNYAMANTKWNLDTLPVPEVNHLKQMLLDEGFEKLGIKGKGKEYFDDPKVYSAYLTVMREAEDNKYDCGISVIMPCFNVENYVAESIESLLDQTFKDIEIICIDDGSEDGTLEKLNYYAKKHKNVHVISEKEKHEPHGPGKARNIGLDEAKGKYIYYMDSDDILSPDCFEYLYNKMESEKLDLIYFEADTFYETEELEMRFPQFKEAYHRHKKYPGVFIGGELFEQFVSNGDFKVSVCMQMVRSDILRDNHIRFESLTAHVDEAYSPNVIVNSLRVVCLDKVFYHRRMRADSVITKKKSLSDRLTAALGVNRELLRLLSGQKKDSPAFKGLRQRYNFMINHSIKLYDTATPDEQKQADEMLSEKDRLLLDLSRML